MSSINIGLALAILVGGACGALLRYGAQLLWPARGARIPPAVLLVNVVGSAIGGTFLALSTAETLNASGALQPVMDSGLALIIITGFCGGLTTFSTFSVETVELATSGAWRAASGNIVLTVVLGIAAAGLAFVITNGVLIATSGAFVG
jgi:CrcB protein